VSASVYGTSSTGEKPYGARRHHTNGGAITLHSERPVITLRGRAPASALATLNSTVLLATMLTARRLVPMVALAFVAQRAAAQGTGTTLVRIPSSTYVAINPLGVVGDIGTLELETGVVQGVTLGGVASYIDVDDSRFTTFDFKFRYYPGEVVLRDWSIGATAGFTRFSNLVEQDLGGKSRQSVTAPTIGIIVDHNWLTGRGQHFLVGTGLGAKRVLASKSDRDRVDIDKAILTARFVIGYAF
jgi:hypothetical protein